jgi:hypothetical protein
LPQSCLGSVQRFNGVSRLIANHRLFGSFESMPEVRALPSTDITRLQRYYDPLRLPSDPPCLPRCWVSARPQRVSPVYPQHLSNVPCPIPRWTETGASVGFFPVSHGLPRSIGGSASTLPLSRPAQASHSLRPAELLSRLTRPLSQGFDPASYPTEPPVSYQTFRLLSGWIPPPLVLRALGAHYGFRARRCAPPRNDDSTWSTA